MYYQWMVTHFLSLSILCHNMSNNNANTDTNTTNSNANPNTMITAERTMSKDARIKLEQR
jgi:hypothetical protein